jgi:oligopeptidase A
MPNPLIKLGFQIPFDQIEAEHVEPGIDRLLAEARAAVDAIIATEGPRSYANTLGALEDATEQLERAMTVVDHLESVATTDALREAYNATRPRVRLYWRSVSSEISTEISDGRAPMISA